MGRLRHAAHERHRCVREVERVADALGIPTTANRALSLSGDDFAEYLLQTKGAYAYLGTANPKKPHTCISNHRGDFDIDEETLPSARRSTRHTRCPSLIRSLPNNCFSMKSP